VYPAAGAYSDVGGSGVGSSAVTEEAEEEATADAPRGCRRLDRRRTGVLESGAGEVVRLSSSSAESSIRTDIRRRTRTRSLRARGGAECRACTLGRRGAGFGCDPDECEETSLDQVGILGREEAGVSQRTSFAQSSSDELRRDELVLEWEDLELPV
jgi:hypothetical protein